MICVQGSFRVCRVQWFCNKRKCYQKVFLMLLFFVKTSLKFLCISALVSLVLTFASVYKCQSRFKSMVGIMLILHPKGFFGFYFIIWNLDAYAHFPV